MNEIDRKVAEAQGWIRMDSLNGWVPRDPKEDGVYLDELILDSEYSPSTNIAQAMELLEEFPKWRLWKIVKCACALYDVNEVRLALEIDNVLSKAISIAYLKAKEKEAQDEKH